MVKKLRWQLFVFCVLCFVFCVLCFVFCVLCFVFCVLCFVFCCSKILFVKSVEWGKAGRQTIYWVVQECNFVEESNAPKQQSVFIETRITFFAADNCVARKQFRYLSFDCQIRVSSKALPFPTTLIELSQSIRKMAIKTEKTI